MAKDVFWFKHDSNASRDIKLLKLRHIHGFSGIGMYWTLIEQLREQPGYKHPSDESSLQLLVSMIGAEWQKFINFYHDCIRLEILIESKGYFYSNSLILRMKQWEANKKNGAKGLAKRWRNDSEMPSETYSETIALREEKNIEELIGSTKMRDSVCMLNKITIEKYTRLLNKFILEQKGTGGIARDVSELKKHFMNWVPKNLIDNTPQEGRKFERV